MAFLRRRHLWFTEGVAYLLLLDLVRSGSSSSHSLRYFYTAVSEPCLGLPQFVSVGYVDDQPIERYDCIMKRDVPQVPWMEKARKEEPQYWERETQISRGTEAVSRRDLVTLRHRFNQSSSTGLHTWQWMYGCEVGPDGRFRGGSSQYAYEGEDFIALDLETLTWTARVPQAQLTKTRWEGDVDEARRFKDYLNGTCVEWLRKYLDYGREALQRTVAPTGRVARKKGYNGQETLYCQLYGFYPKEIEVTWMKDGQDRKPDTFTGGVVPNSDGTYHTWLSIDVDPQEKDHYRCQVGHDSLLEPLDLAWEEPANMWLIVVIVVVVLLVVAILLGAGVAFYMYKRRPPDYKPTPGDSDPGSDSSVKSDSDPGSDSSVKRSSSCSDGSSQDSVTSVTKLV